MTNTSTNQDSSSYLNIDENSSRITQLEEVVKNLSELQLQQSSIINSNLEHLRLEVIRLSEDLASLKKSSKFSTYDFLKLAMEITRIALQITEYHGS